MKNKGNLLGLNASYRADAAVTQFRGGKLTATGFAQCDTEGERSDGVIGWDGNPGDEVTLYTSGIHEAVAGAPIAAGVEVMVGADGRYIPHVPAADNHVCGLSETAALAAGDTFQLNIFHGNPSR